MHPSPDCRPDSAIGDRITVCNCGWRDPSEAAMEWAMWETETEEPDA